MTVLQRISTLIAANINHLLDEAEDPEVLVKQLIREMEESIVDVRRETVRAVARHKHLEKQISGAGEQMDELESKARLVLARGDEARARTLLARKLRLADQREALERERASASELAAGLKGDLSRLEDQVQVARRKRDELVRRKRGAQAQIRMQEASRRSAETLRSVAGAMGSAAGSAEGLARLEDEVGALESEAEAAREVLAPRPDDDAELERLAEDEAVDAELKRLKAELL